MNYTEIKSQEDACKVLSREPKAGEELKDIADAINFLDGEYKPDRSSWTPYFWWDDNGGFGFLFSYYVRWLTTTAAGARRCFRFRTEKISDYFGSEFVELHKKLFNS